MNRFETHNQTYNEGGYGYNPHAKDVRVLIQSDDEQAHAKAEARIQHIIDNVETYKARWNAEVAKHNTPKGLPAHAIPTIEQVVGVTMLEMREVKARMAK